MNEIIKTEKLTKRFAEVTAVSEIDLNVRKGEIYGFLGLNGAGKTTTIRMLLGMFNPTRGRALINGTVVRADSTGLWKDIGYLVEVPYAYPDLTVRENLEIIRRLRLIRDKTAIGNVMNLLKLTRYSNFKARNLSQGNAQRLGLAKALIHNPRILFLDEPANGLDPAGIFEIRELLSDLAKDQGVTVFISSHILGEISRFATRIGIIHEGRLIQEINTQELEQLCQKRLLVNSKDNEKAITILAQQGYECRLTPERLIELADIRAINNPENIASILVGNGVAPSMLQTAEEDLESYFLKKIGITREQS